MSPHRSLTALLALAFLFTLAAPGALAQAVVQDDCDRLTGTVQVADDATNKQDLAKVTHEQAAEAARAALPGATVESTDLEEEDGYLVYEVDLILDGEEYDAYVDAGSGELLCSKRD